MAGRWPDPVPIFIARLTPCPFPTPIAPIAWSAPVTGISPPDAQQVEQPRKWSGMIDNRLALRINRSWSGHPQQRTGPMSAGNATPGRENEANRDGHQSARTR